MQGLQLIFKGGLITSAMLGGLLIVTNPGQKAYKIYATATLSNYLKDDICTQGDGELGEFLTSQCKSLVDVSRLQLQEFISTKTERTNFLVFSIYETNLVLFESLPSYRFQTLGLLRQFYTYNQEEI